MFGRDKGPTDQDFFNDDLEDTKKLYAEVVALSRNINSEFDEYGITFLDRVGSAVPAEDYKNGSLLAELMLLGMALAQEDDLSTDVPDFDPAVYNTLGMKERVAFRNMLKRKRYCFTDYDTVTELWLEAFSKICKNALEASPDIDTSGATAFDVPLIDLYSDPHEAVTQIVYYPLFNDDLSHAKLFETTRERLYNNIRAVSKKEPVPLHGQKDKPIRDLIYTYLGGTCFVDFFLKTKIPLSIDQRTRFEHHLIVGGTGHGKSITLKRLIAHDLEVEDPPSIVVIDSQSNIIPDIAHLKLFRDRNPIIIDPRDNPALNIFDVNQQRLARYDEQQKEQVYNHTVEMFIYLFNSLLGTDLTVKQSTLFNNLIALMLAMPQGMGRNATLLDLMYLMDDPAPYGQAIDILDPITRDFFKKDFREKTYNDTKSQIRYRLQAILGNKTLARLFLAPYNTIDFHEELNRGATILIDTTKAYLGATNSSYFGRIALTLVLNAILERAANPSKKPVFVYIDEAGEYFDKSIDTFLVEARKHRAGLILSHQYMGQLPADLRASVNANTSIKFAGGVSADDARSLASDMRTTADFIKDQPALTFASYIRGFTSSAIPLTFPVDYMQNMEQLSKDEYDQLRRDNRAKYSAPPPDIPAAEEDAPPSERTMKDVTPRQPKSPQKQIPRDPGDDDDYEWE